jgi:DNA-binding LacI/PurR family transcriptional regulator
MAEKLTMSQMAQELNVSRSVVSAVVNNNLGTIRVSANTQKRIKEHLRNRGYVQSKSALMLKNRTDVDSIHILYCGKFIDVDHLIKAMGIMVEDIKESHGLVNICGVDFNHVPQSLEDYVAQGVTRLIWIHANSPDEEICNAEKLFPLLRRMEQVVIYNYDFGESQWDEAYLQQGIHLVGFDRDRSYRKVAEVFSAAGHRNIAISDACSGTNVFMPGNRELERIFQEAEMKVHGLYPPHGSGSANLPDEMFEELIRLHERENVDCAFIRNEMAAAVIVDQLLEKGIRIPEDMGIISFGDSPYARRLKIPLTTFAHPIDEMCAMTMKLIRGSDKTASSHMFASEFRARKSHLPLGS